MTKEEIRNAVNTALKTGNWMLRFSDNGKTRDSYQWADIGKWTIASDWDERPTVKTGLMGAHYSLEGGLLCRNSPDLDFCETDGKHVIVDYDRIKCKKARVLLRNELPPIDYWAGALDLSNFDLANSELPKEVKGALFLSNCNLENTKLPKKLGSALDLSGCDLKGVTLPLNFSGALSLTACKNVKDMLFPETILALYLNRADLPGTKLPTIIKKTLDLSYCDLENVQMPLVVNGGLYLNRCDITKIKLPSLGGGLHLAGCNLNGIKLPEKINGTLRLERCFLYNTTLPKTVIGDLYLQYAQFDKIALPEKIMGTVFLTRKQLKHITVPEVTIHLDSINNIEVVKEENE